MVKTAIVSSKELGTNCWLACRFLEGGRCLRVMRCNYPEKRTCKAVDTEISYLNQLIDLQQRTAGAIVKLVEGRA